eukprot:scaffold2637_cov421-Pavlova_lutheri.AAC.3
MAVRHKGVLGPVSENGGHEALTSGHDRIHVCHVKVHALHQSFAKRIHRRLGRPPGQHGRRLHGHFREQGGQVCIGRIQHQSRHGSILSSVSHGGDCAHASTPQGHQSTLGSFSQSQGDQVSFAGSTASEIEAADGQSCSQQVPRRFVGIHATSAVAMEIEHHTASRFYVLQPRCTQSFVLGFSAAIHHLLFGCISHEAVLSLSCSSIRRSFLSFLGKRHVQRARQALSTCIPNGEIRSSHPCVSQMELSRCTQQFLFGIVART